MATPSLEEFLIQTRILSPVQLDIAKRDAAMRHKRLAPTLIDLGFIDEKRFAQWMAEVTRLPVVDPLPEDEASKLDRRLPRALAREFQVLPIRLDGELLTVATINPLDASALEILRTTTGLTIRPVIARYGELMRLVSKFYPEDDAEPTILPLPFPPAAAEESAPFDIGSSTLVAAQHQPFLTGDESPGSATQVFVHRTPASAPPRLEQIERRLAEVERRLAAIEEALARVLPR